MLGPLGEEAGELPAEHLPQRKGLGFRGLGGFGGLGGLVFKAVDKAFGFFGKD